MKADPSRQWRLLDLQAVDIRLDQIAHARAHLPQTPAISSTESELSDVEVDLVNARTAVDDVQRELTKAEQDVQLVRDRAARDQARLDSGQGSAKDLTSLQHELVSLARRQGELEDLQLEVMERSESLTGRVAQLEQTRAEIATRLDALRAEEAAALRELESESGEVTSRRPDLVAGVGQDLVALYEKIRTTSRGVGAAELKHRRCGGCQLELGTVDLDRIRKAPEDEVVRCEECRRIMIRTGESGL
ncbi:MAG: C4-type zinc ribbon domain-containing protein [Intrasporangium sp.]|nr:C4-type zinc ribbon domain-containing protein [Intrasporangium sp.]MDN5796148.1 C4-type zinc ribbon domain-containing protein [Intrasporangium sp.]